LPVIRAANKSKEEEEKEEVNGGPPPAVEEVDVPRLSIGPSLVPSGLAHVPFVPPPFPAPPGVPPVAGPQSSPLNVVKPAGIPTTWIEKPADKNGGVRWTDPNNSSNFVRAMPGDPASRYPHQQVPYVIRQNGSFRDVNGDPILGSDPAKTPAADIPASQFKFQ
jgi:hypothetical protein